MIKYSYWIVSLLHCFTRILGQSCKDEILKISDAGLIQVSRDSTTVGQSLIITCSTKCAWNWHTIYIDDNIIDKSHTETKDYQIDVTNEILNCQDCNEPDDIDCSDDNQGPIHSVLNVTLFTAGDHYIQCIAHLFDPNSDLWPNNRILSVPSRTVKITGREPDPQTSFSSTIRFTTGSETISPQLSILPTLSLRPSNSSFSNSFNNSLTKVIQSQTETIINYTITIAQSSMQASPGLTITKNTISESTIHTSNTIINPRIDSQSSCDCSINSETAIVIITLGILAVICLSLILITMVLIFVNRRTVARYNQLYLQLKQTNLSTAISDIQCELNKIE